MTKLDLFNKRGEVVAQTLVDDKDALWLKDYSLWIKSDEHGDRAMTTDDGQKVAVSRLIVQRLDKDVEDKLVDHINGLTLDNQRDNLRVTDATGNSRNRRKSKRAVLYKNVRLRRGKYQAYITINYKPTFIGHFDDPRDAAIAYDINAAEYFGEFASLNVPDASPEDRARVVAIVANPKKHKGTSRFRGVGRHGSNWRATITVDYKPRCLGTFPTEEEAASAYNEAAFQQLGSSAKLNVL